MLLTKTTFGAGMGVLVLLAVFGREVFEAGDIGIGVLYAARGLGALVGPFAGALAGRATTTEAIMRAISVAVVVFVVPATRLLPLAPGLGVAAICVFVAHLGGGVQWMLSSYGLQRATPDAVRGRVLSIDFALVTMATTPLDQLLAGVLAVTVGPVDDALRDGRHWSR